MRNGVQEVYVGRQEDGLRFLGDKKQIAVVGTFLFRARMSIVS